MRLHLVHGLDDRERRDVVLDVVGDLDGAAPVGLGDRALHRVRGPVAVHDHVPEDVAGGAADGLDERAVAAEVALLVGVEDADERHLGQVEALAQQVDAHQHVEDAEAEVADDLDALQGVDIAVQVADLDPRLAQVVGEVLGHLLGERGDEAALVALDAPAQLRDEVVDLPVRLLHLDGRIDEPGRPDDLLDDLRGAPLLVRARASR